jgi:putative membrane protein
MNFIIKFLILAAVLSLFVIFYNNGAYIKVTNPNDFKSIVVFLAALVLLNTFVKPILKLFTFPLNCLTFGLFSFVVNFIIVYFADKLVDSFEFTDWKYTFIFSILFALASSIIDYFLKDKD